MAWAKWLEVSAHSDTIQAAQLFCYTSICTLYVHWSLHCTYLCTYICILLCKYLCLHSGRPTVLLYFYLFCTNHTLADNKISCFVDTKGNVLVKANKMFWWRPRKMFWGSPRKCFLVDAWGEMYDRNLNHIKLFSSGQKFLDLNVFCNVFCIRSRQIWMDVFQIHKILANFFCNHLSMSCHADHAVPSEPFWAIDRKVREVLDHLDLESSRALESSSGSGKFTWTWPGC